jgi:hypothetical protein
LVALQAFLIAEAIIDGSDWWTAGYVAGMCVAYGLVAVGCWRASNRPTIAVDGASLAIDERLRNQEAFDAVNLFVYLICAGILLSLDGGSPDWVKLLGLAGLVLVVTIGPVATSRQPWRRPASAEFKGIWHVQS